MKSINLLPEVRVAKLQAAHKRRLSTTITVLVGLVLGGVIIGLLLIIGYYIGETKIRTNTAKNLQAEVDKSKDLEENATTVQQHLASFVSLNGKRVSASVIFGQLVKTIPPDVTVTTFSLTDANSAAIGGTAPSYKELGVFAQALQDYNVTFKPQPNLDRKPIFTNIVITQSSKGTGIAANTVNYQITFDLDASILQSNANIH